MKKSDIRKWAKSYRKTLDISKLSNAICSNIRNMELYQKARHVMIFYPLSDEINLLPLLEDDKKFYLPRVSGEELLACPYKDGDVLELSDLKILEPISDSVENSVPDIVFTPALCADRSFYRLGYGGGFYDRFMKNRSPETKFLCVVPEELVIDDLPIDEFDVKCDGIITQKKASL